MSNSLILNYLYNPHQHIQAHNSRRRPCSTIGHTSKQNSKEAAHLRTIPTLLMPTHINHTQSSPPYPVLPYQQRPPAQPGDTPATRTQDRPPSPDCTHSRTIQPTYMWLHHTHYHMQVPSFCKGTPVKTEAIRPARTLSPTQVETPCLIRGHLGHQKSSSQLRWIPHYSITSLYSLKTKKETEVKDQRHYNHTKPRNLYTSVRTAINNCQSNMLPPEPTYPTISSPKSSNTEEA